MSSPCVCSLLLLSLFCLLSFFSFPPLPLFFLSFTAIPLTRRDTPSAPTRKTTTMTTTTPQHQYHSTQQQTSREQPRQHVVGSFGSQSASQVLRRTVTREKSSPQGLNHDHRDIFYSHLICINFIFLFCLFVSVFTLFLSVCLFLCCRLPVLSAVWPFLAFSPTEKHTHTQRGDTICLTTPYHTSEQ